MRGEKGVTVVLDDIVKFSNESGSLVVRQVKVHRLDMGSRVPVAKAEARLPVMVLSVEMIAAPLVIWGEAG